MKSIFPVLFFCILSASNPSLATNCDRRSTIGALLDRSDDPNIYLNPTRFEQISAEHRSMGLSEPTVTLTSFQSARNYVQRFPDFKARGFQIGDFTRWRKVYARLERSSLHGKFVGWETKLPNGNFARYRLDYDPERGAHYNIEISAPNSSGVRQTYKLAVQFLCDGHICSVAETMRYLSE